MLLRLLLFALLVGVVLSLLKGRLRGRPDDGRRPPSSPASASPPATRSGGAMLACAQCGVHVPASDALVDARGQPFCCEAHRDARRR